jgi:hypothetical protein
VAAKLKIEKAFWLKIKQFWPFEEIYIFCNIGHLGWRAWLSDITFKGNPVRMIQAKFGLNWPRFVFGNPDFHPRWPPS